jgi:glycosyltransferase involved in cell wall biosynthesis
MGGKTILLIPAYKPSQELPALVRRIRDLDEGGALGPVLVVNDGSGPDFDPVFAALRGLNGVSVVDHAINLGKGAALKTGFNHALVTWPDASGIVTADADGQHAPEDVLRVALALIETPGDLVLGVRQFRQIPLRSLVGNKISRLVFRIFAGFGLSDTQTGLRGWPKTYCLDALRITLNGYDFELESLMKKTTGRRLREVPIQTIYLDGNQSSHFNPIRDSMRISFVFLRYCGSSALAATVDYLVFMGTLEWSGSIASAQFLARTAAVMVAFVVARNLVFQSRTNWAGSLVKYLLLVAAMGVVSYSMIQFLHTRVGVGVLVAKLLSEGILFLGNFAVQRDFIFSKKSD